METFCSKPQKIVLLGNVASMMLNFREHLIKTLVEKGHKVYCLAQNYSAQDRATIADWGATAINSPLNAKGLNPLKDLSAVLKLSNIFLSIKPDVVFSFFVKPVIFGTIAARLAKVPRVIGMIEGLGNAFSVHAKGISKKTLFIKSIQIFLYKFSLPKLDCLILLNNDDRIDLIEKYNLKIKNLEVLGGIGVDLNEFYYIEPSVKNISFIFVARLLREKGIYEYLQAAERVKALYPEVVFYILGGFDKDNPFALREKDLQPYLTKGIVAHPGYVTNVAEWMAKANVFVLPSFYREGVPRSTQEAMAIGRPIITTNSVGCKETVDHGVNGFLIRPFDSDDLVEKMLFFIRNPTEIEKMGNESRRIAEEKFDVHKVNKRLLNIIIGNKVKR